SVSEWTMRKPERQSIMCPASRVPEQLCSLCGKCCEKSGFANSFIRKPISVFPVFLPSSQRRHQPASGIEASLAFLDERRKRSRQHRGDFFGRCLVNLAQGGAERP
ncbi:hypothetical protein, partial [Mesorhizobium sp. M8A.F.Ca.ET.197.01.1.1]|uniref:hypothetical protein n=1 Tax=Mesorhizobium sp. M8A.F.Ca.ET.197.01.1.1 TaxID=2563965 RepID=UPI001AEEE1DE